MHLYIYASMCVVVYVCVCVCVCVCVYVYMHTTYRYLSIYANTSHTEKRSIYLSIYLVIIYTYLSNVDPYDRGGGACGAPPGAAPPARARRTAPGMCRHAQRAETRS